MRTFSTAVSKSSRFIIQSNFFSCEHISYTGYDDVVMARILRLPIDVGMWKIKKLKS